MRLDLRSPQSLTLTLALLAAVASGCQAALPLARSTVATATSPTQALKASPGVVTIALGPLLATANKGRHLQDFGDTNITHVRLTAYGSDISTSVSSTISWPAGQGAAVPSISLTVPAGFNRVLQLDGLDAQEHVLATMRTSSTIGAGSNATVPISAETDAVARVLLDLIQDTSDTNASATALTTSDLSAAIETIVHIITGYRADNTYTGVAPSLFRSHAFANYIRAHGASTIALGGATGSIGGSGGIELDVTVTSGGGATEETNAQVVVYSPNGPNNTSSDEEGSAIAAITDIAPGTWLVKATTFGGLVGFRQVTVKDGDPTQKLVIDCAAPGVPTAYMGYGSGAVGVDITPLSFIEPSAGPWLDTGGQDQSYTLAGGINTITNLVSGVVANFAFSADSRINPNILSVSTHSKVVCQPDGTTYVLLDDQVFSVPLAGGTFKRLAWGKPYAPDGVVQAPLASIAVASDGTLYLSDTDGVIYSVAPTAPGLITRLGQSGDVRTLKGDHGSCDLLIAADNTLYFAGATHIYKFDPTKTSNQFSLFTTGSERAIALSNGPSGEIYAIEDNTSKDIVAITSTGTIGAQFGVNGTSYQDPTSLAFDGSSKLFIADTGDNLIDVTPTTSPSITLFAGTGILGDSSGSKIFASFDQPGSIAYNANVGSHKLMILDTANGRLCSTGLGPTDEVTDVLKLTGPGIDLGGPTESRFLNLSSLAVDADGDTYALDTTAHQIFEIDSNGTVTSYAGNGQSLPPTPSNGSLGTLKQIVYGGSKDLLYGLTANHELLTIQAGLVTTVSPTDQVDAIALDDQGALYGHNSHGFFTLTPAGNEGDITSSSASVIAFTVIANQANNSFIYTTKTNATPFAGGNELRMVVGPGPSSEDSLLVSGLDSVVGLVSENGGNVVDFIDNHVINSYNMQTTIATKLSGQTTTGADVDGALDESAAYLNPNALALDQRNPQNIYLGEPTKVRLLRKHVS